MRKSKQKPTGTIGLFDVGAHGARRRAGGPGIGSAEQQGHAGEYLQGEFTVERGTRRGIITVPCPAYCSRVTVEVTSTGDFQTEPPNRHKAIAAAKFAFARLGARGCGANIRIESNIEQGIGAGSSTCDVSATLFASAMALGQSLSEDEVARVAVEIETASDPTMFTPRPDRVPVFAQRAGAIIEMLEGGQLPIEHLLIVDGPPILTLDHPPAIYSKRMIREFDLLLEGARLAHGRRDVALFGAISARSAEINQAYLAKPNFDAWMRLSERYGAVGIAVSHSGSAVSFMFDRRDPNRDGRIDELIAELAFIGVMPRLRFELGDDDEAEPGAAR